MDIGQAFLTGGITTGLGAIAYFSHRWVIDPVLEQRRLVARIAHALTFYGNVFYIEGLNDPRRSDELRTAVLALRKLAADLRESRRLIPCYRFLAGCGIVISRGALQQASAELIGWSNSIYRPDDTHERRRRIGEHLGIGYDIDVTPGTRDSRQITSTAA